MFKRLFDVTFSSVCIFLFLPLFLCISILILLDSRGKIFYKQLRVGRNNKDFYLFKFRTMVQDAENKGLLTIGNKDIRITKIGYYLRRYKLDELPQFFNVLLGDMSIVGPRPEVRRYVELYSLDQKKVLTVKPGITDYASLCYFHEGEILSRATDPEKIYISEIMPHKLSINLQYVKEGNLLTDFKIILKTIFRIIKK